MPEDIQELLPFLAYATLFVGVILAVEGLRRVADSNETTREAKNRRMCMLAEVSSREEVFELLKDSGVLDAGQNSRSYPSPLRILKQAGVRFGAAKLFIFSTIFGGLIFIAASNLFSVPISAAVAVIIALGFPWMLLVQSRKKRIENLGNQLPDALAGTTRRCPAADGRLCGDFRDPGEYRGCGTELPGCSSTTGRGPTGLEGVARPREPGRS